MPDPVHPYPTPTQIPLSDRKRESFIEVQQCNVLKLPKYFRPLYNHGLLHLIPLETTPDVLNVLSSPDPPSRPHVRLAPCNHRESSRLRGKKPDGTPMEDPEAAFLAHARKPYNGGYSIHTADKFSDPPSSSSCATSRRLPEDVSMDASNVSADGTLRFRQVPTSFFASFSLSCRHLFVRGDSLCLATGCAIMMHSRNTAHICFSFPLVYSLRLATLSKDITRRWVNRW